MSSFSEKNVNSRNNHRYAVVVQDLSSQWIHSYPCKTQIFSRYEKRVDESFLDYPKVIFTNKSLELGKSCEESSRSHCTTTPHRSQTNGIAERAVRRIKEGTSAIKEGTSAVLLQSGLDEKWWANSMDCYCHLRNVQDLSNGKTFF